MLCQLLSKASLSFLDFVFSIGDEDADHLFKLIKVDEAVTIQIDFLYDFLPHSLVLAHVVT